MRVTGNTSAGGLGGAGNEMGAEYRARVGALLASALLREEELGEVGLPEIPGIPALLQAESDDPFDDLALVLHGGGRVLFQAKRSLTLDRRETSAFARVISNLCLAVEQAIDGSWMVIACARPSGSVRALARALRRGRRPAQGAMTGAEATALSSLLDLVRRSGLDDGKVSDLLRCLIVWEVDPSEGDAAIALASRLDGRVVLAGRGSQAASALADTVRELARERTGLDARGLLAALDRRGLELADPHGSSSVVSQRQALTDYRARVTRLGSTLRLLGLGGDLAHLPFRAVDADVRVEDGIPLHRALRRQGRLLLVGNPGGGKSTALRALATHAATRPDWPTPILVHLQRLASRPGTMPAAVVAAAAEDAPPEQRVALTSALEYELEQGRCLLLLDGLDEVRRGRKLLIAGLGDWLRGLHPDTEVVVATRPVAVDDAQQLDLPVALLGHPAQPTRTVSAILQAAASRQESNGARWAEEREQWVLAHLSRDWALISTPLIPVMLSVAAARSRRVSELPTRRAEILKRVLGDVMADWEVEYRHRGEARIGALAGSLATEALGETFRMLSRRALGPTPPSKTDMTEMVQRHLEGSFDLGAGAAKATALDAIAFWIEAGFFEFSRDELRAALRLFAELGVALDMSLSDASRWRAWLEHADGVEALEEEVVCLAACLSAEIAKEWSTRIVADPDPDRVETFLRVVGDGAEIDAAMRSALVESVTSRVWADPRQCEGLAVQMTQLPASEGDRHLVERMVAEQLPLERQVIVRALLVCGWDESGEGAEERLRAVLEMPHPDSDVTPGQEGETSDGPLDWRWARAFEEAAQRLAGGKRRDAERVIVRVAEYKRATGAFRDRVRGALRDGGHGDLEDCLIAHANQSTSVDGGRISWARSASSPACAADPDALRVIACMSQATGLTVRQRRCLHDLDAFIRTASIDWLDPGWPAEHPDAARCWFAGAAILGGFDPGVLSAQANVVLTELDAGEDTNYMLGDGKIERLELDHWLDAEQPEQVLGDLVSAFAVATKEVASRIARAIRLAPETLGPGRALAPVISSLSGSRSGLSGFFRLWLAARATLASAPLAVADDYATGWSAATDSMLRMAAAEWWSFRFETSGEREAEMLRALADDAKEVRVEARSWLSHPRPAAADEVIDAHPAQGCSVPILFITWNNYGGGDLKLMPVSQVQDAA